MSDEVPERGRRNIDGSVDVWVRGRQVHFPAAGGKPTVSEDPPPPEVGAPPADARIARRAAVTSVRVGDWFVSVEDDVVRVRRTTPNSGESPTVFYRLRGG